MKAIQSRSVPPPVAVVMTAGLGGMTGGHVGMTAAHAAVAVADEIAGREEIEFSGGSDQICK